jgi:ACS family hexuronate transporter-like MFS transporter
MIPSQYYRWWILWLLFFATTINYLDRIVFSVLVIDIRQELHITDQTYGLVTSAFQAAYTLGFIFAGRLIDRFGTKAGYAAATLWWSISATLHAVARNPFDLGIWRAMLGFGESGNFPAAIKAVAEWFPPEERAFATGIFNSGTTIASVAGPPALLALSAVWGWRSAFILTGSLGFVWMILWWLTYSRPAAASGAASEPQIGWMEALGHRETWGFALGKFFTDPVWWFYLFWLPLYFIDVRKVEKSEVGWIISVVYVASAVGSVAGGWLSGMLINRGWSNGRARKLAMAICAACMPVAALGVLSPSVVGAVALFGLATAGHQGWSANLYTTASDVFPKNAVASVIGIGGALGGLGGVIFSALIPGFLIPLIGYKPVFLAMGLFYLIAWLSVHLFMGDLHRIGGAPATTLEAAPSK